MEHTKIIYPITFSSTLQPHRSRVEKENLGYQVGCMEKSLCRIQDDHFLGGLRRAAFWGRMVATPSSSFPSASCQPACTLLMLEEAGAKFTLAFSEVVNSIPRARERRPGSCLHTAPQAQSPHLEHVQVSMFTHTMQWGDRFAWKLCPEPAAGRALGSQGTPASPLCHPFCNVAPVE